MNVHSECILYCESVPTYSYTSNSSIQYIWMYICAQCTYYIYTRTGCNFIIDILPDFIMPHVWRMFQNGRAKYRTRVLYTKSNPTTAYLDVQCKIECSDLLLLKIRATFSGSSVKKSNLKGCRLKPSSNIFHSDLGNICVVQLVQNCPLKTILWMKTKRRCTAANFFLLL